jgi:hypothetical protein
MKEPIFLFHNFRKRKERDCMGEKDVALKNYFTPERFADMFNAIVFNGRRTVDPRNVTSWEKETDEGRWHF